MNTPEIIKSQLVDLNILQAMRLNGLKPMLLKIDENTLRVAARKGTKSTNVDIKLTPADLYEVTIGKVNLRNVNDQESSKIEDVFAEDLTQIFIDAFKIQLLQLA